jgi:pimeloyl-ACP methyl ester carboxylesterase
MISSSPEKGNASSRSVRRTILMTTAAALAVSALYVQWCSRRAERENPPRGDFIAVDGVRLHVLDTGGDKQVVLLIHGNGSMIQELEVSGLLEVLGQDYRVLVFDRPGFGYSERPPSVAWTPAAQADLLSRAMRRLGVGSAIVIGHSWGNMVALELALEHRSQVKALLLLGGFYFPESRWDVALLSIPAVPIIGNLMRHTLSPLVAKALSGVALRRMFAPRAVSESFKRRFPMDLALRPFNIRAAAEDLAMMMSAAISLEQRYGQLSQPTIILAGSGDRIVNPEHHSARLQAAIPQSEFHMLPNEGHMLHHHASLTILQAVNKLFAASRDLQASLQKPDKLGSIG